MTKQSLTHDERAIALCLHDGDNIAVMAAEGNKNSQCVCELADGSRREFALATDVPFGHKVSIEAFEKGAVVSKYGQPIGITTESIPLGAHVHSHNLAGYKADLAGGAK